MVSSGETHRASAYHHNTHHAVFLLYNEFNCCYAPLQLFGSTIKRSRKGELLIMVNLIHIREFIRFFFAGITAALGNLAAVWLARRFVSLETALLIGLFAGLTISFILSKLVAFESQSWERASGEALRFLLVYAVGCIVYYTAAIIFVRSALARGLAGEAAEMGGAFAGSALMTFSSYFGHRYFTYRSHERLNTGTVRRDHLKS
jgi:putative flippase GtrA